VTGQLEEQIKIRLGKPEKKKKKSDLGKMTIGFNLNIFGQFKKYAKKDQDCRSRSRKAIDIRIIWMQAGYGNRMESRYMVRCCS
jgi:hypothetical protein